MNNFSAIISISTDRFWEKKSTGDSALFTLSELRFI